jgi:uncharacterized protein YkwD
VKQLFHLSGIILIFLIGMASCEKDDDSSSDISQNIPAQNNNSSDSSNNSSSDTTNNNADSSNNNNPPADKIGCNTDQELELISLIRDYRDSKGLPEIPISKALTKVADYHVRDLINNKPNRSGGCNLHSWSEQEQWTKCCYKEDHSNAECMWSKPGEITDYTANGYEIAFINPSGATPQGALDGWKSSDDHNNVIVNKEQWKDNDWKAMGVAVKGNYAVVWFGEPEDENGKPENCE